MYTSGWPKNQNKCWYRIGSPPPAGSKKEVLKLRSSNNMVIPPARTGRASKSKMAVINTDQTNNGIFSIVMAGERILMIVEMKLIAPRMDETPAICKEKIVKSTLGPLWAKYWERGGYTVHPVPAPCSLMVPLVISKKEGGRSQNLKLFIRGNAISGAPIINGTNQFPNPPIRIGITKKKIIMKACLVTITLYIWSSLRIDPGCLSSDRIIKLREVPTVAAQRPKIKYRVPMSLWFVENIHRRRGVRF